MCPVVFHQSYLDDVGLGKGCECESAGSDTRLNSCVLLEVLLVLLCACNEGAVHVSFMCMMPVTLREQSCMNARAQCCSRVQLNEVGILFF